MQRGALVSGLLAAAVAPATGRAVEPNGASSASPTVVELNIQGEIEPVLAEYITGGIEQAAREHAALVLITINTPGGLDTSMRSIIQAMLRSSVPVATYVYPSGGRAASAGFFILLAGDVDAMSPGTETGAASPILEIGGQPVRVDATLNKKILNDASAFLRSYAIKRGRNVDLAVTAVTEAKAFSDKEALDGGLIDLTASSPKDLLAKLDGRTILRIDGSSEKLATAHATVHVVEMTPREKFLSRIVQPDVFFVLLLVGVLGLYAEFTHPGMFAPGVVGGIALLLALFAMHLLPVNFAGLLLILAALILFVLEAKFPTHGVLGAGGVAALVLGALMLIRSPLTGGGVSPAVALGVAIPAAVIVVILMRLVLRSRAWKQTTGREELAGEEGEITAAIGPPGGAGMVRVHGELWRAVAAPGASLAAGTRVRVRQVDGLTLEVEEVRPPQAVSS